MSVVVKGSAPHNLISAPLRTKVYEHAEYRKLVMKNEATVLDTIVGDLSYVGGCHGTFATPSLFLICLVKLLHLNLSVEILLEYLHQKDFKYLTVLAAMYVRLVSQPLVVWKHLEPLLNDYRKIVVRRKDGSYYLTHVDTIVYDLLHEESLFDVHLPRMPLGRYEMEKAYPTGFE